MYIVLDTTDAVKRQRYMEKIKEYMDRAETLKECIKQEETGKYRGSITMFFLDHYNCYGKSSIRII